ncbi:hypothetical protein [Desulforamulus ferrireducens]|uniref:Uncharacterized protein n=1 Tax=Desulforamulus ferrireducens TaxID=1833852 RepID=A0A1S6IV37_9FIRM|nr:hypothetical protein [Desulforamulus ferrireducens]AQS58630.1 hypothetical protein B0537_05745 [Desulforamulus ferrireducens]
MNKINELCSQLFDSLTIIKGYLKLNVEHKNVDYTPLILQEVNEIEKLLQQVVDELKKLIMLFSGLCLLGGGFCLPETRLRTTVVVCR